MELRVLDRFSATGTTHNSDHSKKQSVSSHRPSDAEIRRAVREFEERKNRPIEKSPVVDKVEISEKAKTIKSEKVESTEVEKAEKIEIVEEVESDIGRNDPNSESTREKLRHVLRSNSFQFSEEERRALGDILNQDKS